MAHLYWLIQLFAPLGLLIILNQTKINFQINIKLIFKNRSSTNYKTFIINDKIFVYIYTRINVFQHVILKYSSLEYNYSKKIYYYYYYYDSLFNIKKYNHNKNKLFEWSNQINPNINFHLIFLYPSFVLKHIIQLNSIL